uniref:DUF3615 domain-containing protein n=1 Tax=Oryza brachyantha TaxID=4533 RepID=J3MHD0_ORYBR
MLHRDMRNFVSLAKEAEKQSFIVKNDPGCSVYRSFKRSDQTNTCAEKAARFYYNKLHPGLFLHDLEALDSHSFDRHEYDKQDQKAYYHVNFKAKKGNRTSEPSIFFAELSGENGPDRVTICAELESPGKIDNCAFCTGIFHPPDDFVGFMSPDHPV